MKYVLIIILTLYLSNLNESKFTCEQSANLVDRDIINSIKGLEDNYYSENFKNCIEILMRKGHYEALEFFLNELLKRGIRFKDDLNKSISSYNEFLNKIKNKFRFKENDYQRASPAIRWAQNKDYVFLEVKFSHRQDTPGCPEVEEEFFDIVNGNEIMFHAYCSIGDVPIKFDFHLKLFGEVIKLRSHWGISSAQKFQVTLKKTTQGDHWDTLLKEGTELPNNIQKWFEMEQKYKNEENLEDEDDDDFVIETKQKKKKRRKTDFNPIFGK